MQHFYLDNFKFPLEKNCPIDLFFVLFTVSYKNYFEIQFIFQLWKYEFYFFYISCLGFFYFNKWTDSKQSYVNSFTEWRHGRGGHLTLADEDLTTKTVNSWRRINTLKHYGVKDSAVMSLVNKQNESFSSNCKWSVNLFMII